MRRTDDHVEDRHWWPLSDALSWALLCLILTYLGVIVGFYLGREEGRFLWPGC